MIAVIFAAQLVPQSLVESADAANLAYVQCLFDVSRESGDAGLSAAEFERKLDRACLAEDRALREMSTKVLNRRGDRNAATTAERLNREARRGVVESYRTTLDVRPQVEQLAEACRTRPDVCRE